jgi:hypothetical protein
MTFFFAPPGSWWIWREIGDCLRNDMTAGLIGALVAFLRVYRPPGMICVEKELLDYYDGCDRALINWCGLFLRTLRGPVMFLG